VTGASDLTIVLVEVIVAVWKNVGQEPEKVVRAVKMHEYLRWWDIGTLRPMRPQTTQGMIILGRGPIVGHKFDPDLKFVSLSMLSLSLPCLSPTSRRWRASWFHVLYSRCVLVPGLTEGINQSRFSVNSVRSDKVPFTWFPSQYQVSYEKILDVVCRPFNSSS